MMPPERRLSFMLAAAGAAGLGVLALVTDGHTLMRGYLVVAIAMAAIPAGALGVLLLSYLVRGAWTNGLHVALTAAALTTPVAGLFFVPVLLGLGWIYPWIETAPGPPGSFKASYLAPDFFSVRTVAYFAIWTGLAVWARRAWGDPARMLAAASAGLIAYALTASLAGVDWLQSLTPQFHSSIYGLIHLTFQLLAGYAFALVIVLARANAQTHRYGAILLSLLLLWAYNHAMQYIIVWSGNIPEEAIWYQRREHGVWGLTLWILVLAQFVIPFSAMLSEQVRTSRQGVLSVAGASLALRLFESVLLGLPGVAEPSWYLAASIASAALALGGLGFTAFAIIMELCAASPHDGRPMQAVSTAREA